MHKKFGFFLICFAIAAFLLPISAKADMGPKPSVVINFTGLSGESYYVTLLSETASTGPHSSFDSSHIQKIKEDDKDYKIWEKFESYMDKDGFYFLQFFEDCSETGEFTWSYYPPEKFKILLYFPEKDSFLASQDIYERYAFDSYYTVDCQGLQIQSVTKNETLQAEKNYPYNRELFSLVIRIIGTILIEILIALPFGFIRKKQLLVIAVMNVITQTVLNILLNLINYGQGSSAFEFHYLWLEFLVFIMEACAYSKLLPKYQDNHSALIPLYAFTANAASFFLGLFLAHLIPGIF